METWEALFMSRVVRLTSRERLVKLRPSKAARQSRQLPSRTFPRTRCGYYRFGATPFCTTNGAPPQMIAHREPLPHKRIRS